jgi:hypothetical protein
MPQTTPTTSPLELATAKLFADFIRQLQPQMHNGSVTLVQLIETAKKMAHDGEHLSQIYHDICKHNTTKQHPIPQEEMFRHRRVFHFRRLVIHYFMLISDGKQEVDHPISRHWLLQWYDVLEIALGKDYFADPHQKCTDLVNELKHHAEFTYHDFLVHPNAMFEYAILMTRLAVFIEVNPQKRIEWLVKAMASNPNTHAVNGLRVHTNDSPPPTFQQIKGLVIGVFSHVFHYIQAHHWEADIQKQMGEMKYTPTTLFTHLLVHIESLAKDV